MLINEKLTTETAAALEAGMELGADGAKFEKFEGVPVIVRRNGVTTEFRPELLARPTRATGTLALHGLVSFCEHFKKYKNHDSIILVDADPEGKRGAKFVGILNYHGVTDPAHGDFRDEYTAKLSFEWNRWMAKNGVMMAHREFLEHLEDVRDLIVEPAGADLMELIGNLEGKVNATFDNALNLHNGSMKLSYSEDVEIKSGQLAGKRKDEMIVPTEIVAQLPIFEYEAPYKVTCRLRYRIQNKQLMFGYEVKSPHLLIQDAVKGQCAVVETVTETKPMYGVCPVK